MLDILLINQDVLESLCKVGLPQGNVYEFMAMQVQKFDKKVQAEQKKLNMLEEYKHNLKKLQEKSLLENKSTDFKNKRESYRASSKPKINRNINISFL